MKIKAAWLGDPHILNMVLGNPVNQSEFILAFLNVSHFVWMEYKLKNRTDQQNGAE